MTEVHAGWTMYSRCVKLSRSRCAGSTLEFPIADTFFLISFMASRRLVLVLPTILFANATGIGSYLCAG